MSDFVRPIIMRNCAFCKTLARHSEMLKYSTRRYAHPKCMLEKKGAKTFELLSDYEIGRFPMKVAEAAGLGKELQRALYEAAHREAPSFDVLEFPTCKACEDPMPADAGDELELCPKCHEKTPAGFLRRQLISSSEAVPCDTQHEKPCSDCPWARASLPGWLGGLSVDEWLTAVRHDGRVDCHTRLGPQCAGAAIFRRNIAKLPRDHSLLMLPRDTELVFASGDEFRAHHEAGVQPTPPAARRSPRRRRE